MNLDSPFARRLLPLLIDVVLVVVFATIGARTHDGGLTLAQVGDVAWPFLVGLGIAHAFGRLPLTWRFGLVAWVSTVAVAMVLRQLAGDGTAFSFIVVATLFNLATLVGWRLVLALLARRR